jgi:hypothetical protein
MQHLIVHGDPGIRKDAIIDYDDTEYVCFSIQRQGEWHGPERVQLWCTIGTEEEREAFERREYIPVHLEVDDVDADAVDVIKAKGDPATQ